MWLEAGGEIAAGLLTFADAVTQSKTANVEMMITSMDRLEFSIKPEGVSIWDNFNKRDIADFDIVHLRNIDKSVNLLDYARAITAYVQHRGNKVVEEIDEGFAIGKLSQMTLFSLGALPTPQTVSSWDHATLEKLALATFSFPMIVKANNAMKGSDNHLVNDAVELARVLNENPLTQYVIQEYVPNDGDYRVLFGGYSQPPLVFKRLRIEGSHLSNTSKGGEPVFATIDELDHGYTIALEAAKAVERTFTGIDIMRNQKTNEWVLLEANVNPALTMGAFLEEKTNLYSRMINEKLGE